MTRILLIEDELPLLESLTSIFELHDFEVTAVSNGIDGMKKIKDIHVQPDVIVCDINLPDVNGYEILKEAKSKPDKYKIPFIFLSAFADKQDVRIGMNMGADDYITKPFSISDLVATVNAHIKLARQKQTLFQSELNNTWYGILNTNFRQEFFSPLNAALSLSQSLIAASGNAADLYKESMELIYHSCFRMYRNTRNLIVTSALITGKLPDNLQTNTSVNITDTITECINNFGYRAQNGKEIDWVSEIPDSLHLSQSNQEALTIIITELLDNAVKFAKKGTKISVALNNYPAWQAQLVIRNQHNNQPNIEYQDIQPFKKFHTDVSYEGMGVGLYIAKTLCNFWGYNISVENDLETCAACISLK